MAGQNPYLEAGQIALPRNKYHLTFIQEETGEEKTVTVDPEKIPYEKHGLPGSILDIALGCGLGLDHACGGVCACATCHVIIKAGLETCNEPSDEELDKLDNAYGLTAKSRLGCRCVPDGSADVTVLIPKVNRNLSREGRP